MSRALKLDKRGKLVESEASVQARIVQFLEAHSFLVFQNRSHGLGGKIAAFATKEQAGSPDLFVWGDSQRLRIKAVAPPGSSIECPGGQYWATIEIPRHFAVEVKRKGGKPSPAQIEWAGRFTALGHLLIVAEDTPIIERTLREKGWL